MHAYCLEHSCIFAFGRILRVQVNLARRLSKLYLLALLLGCSVLLGCVALSGCSGEENIPLKKLDPKVDSVLGDLPKDYKETRPSYVRKGSSSKIGRDPSGVNQSKLTMVSLLPAAKSVNEVMNARRYSFLVPRCSRLGFVKGFSLSWETPHHSGSTVRRVLASDRFAMAVPLRQDLNSQTSRRKIRCSRRSQASHGSTEAVADSR